MRTVPVFLLLVGLSAAAATPSPGGSEVWAVAVFPSGAEFSLEIAADEASRSRGYMFREKVGRREGMLFPYDKSGHYSFWMKNCKVPLDIIWLDESFKVVEVAHDRPPCPREGECPLITPARPARYILEVAGGTAREEGLGLGDRIHIQWNPTLHP